MCSFGGKNPEDERKKNTSPQKRKNKSQHLGSCDPPDRKDSQPEASFKGKRSHTGSKPVPCGKPSRTRSSDSFSKGPSVRSRVPALAVWGAELGAEQPWSVPGWSWARKPPGRCSRYRAPSPTSSLRQEHRAGEWPLLECPVVVTAMPTLSTPTSGQFSGKALDGGLLQNSAPRTTETCRSSLRPPPPAWVWVASGPDRQLYQRTLERIRTDGRRGGKVGA